MAKDNTHQYIASLQKLLAEEGASVESRYIVCKHFDNPIHYLEAGQGKPLIMVHGGGGNSAQWANLIRSLQGSHRLLIVDRPGCGLSGGFNYRGVDFKQHSVQFISSFMDALGIAVADFAANSMGAYWTVLFAMERPEKVHKLVLLGAPAGLDRELPFFLRLLGLRGINDLLWATVAKPSITGTKKLYEMMLVAHADKLSDEFIACSYWGSVLPGYKLGWLTMLENISTLKGLNNRYFIGDKIHKLSTPTLFLWGEKDAFQLVQEGKKVAITMPSAEFHMVPDAGHLPWLDEPEFCLQKMKAFLS